MLHGKKAAKIQSKLQKKLFLEIHLDLTYQQLKLNQKIYQKSNYYRLVVLSNLENSKSEIRRLIKGNAVKLNDQIISDEKLIINNNYLKIII